MAKTSITVARREKCGRNVRLTMSTGYTLVVPSSHPLAQGCDDVAEAAQRVVPKTADEWNRQIVATQRAARRGR